jgi:hypothetical protein
VAPGVFLYLEMRALLVRDAMGIQETILESAFASVTAAYAEVTGKRLFRVGKTPLVVDTCKEFTRLQFLLHSSTVALMEEAVGMYGREWCMETFKSKFPPFYVVIGEKCRKRLIRNHRPAVVQSAEALKLQGLEIARNLKSLMGDTAALELVTDGWPVDERLRVSVFFALRKGRDVKSTGA